MKPSPFFLLGRLTTPQSTFSPRKPRCIAPIPSIPSWRLAGKLFPKSPKCEKIVSLLDVKWSVSFSDPNPPIHPQVRIPTSNPLQIKPLAEVYFAFLKFCGPSSLPRPIPSSRTCRARELSRAHLIPQPIPSSCTCRARVLSRAERELSPSLSFSFSRTRKRIVRQYIRRIEF